MSLFYTELAEWWPLLSAPEEYWEEAALYERVLLEGCSDDARTLLELGSGGGNNASFLKKRFETTLVDPSSGMLDVSRTLNPECKHVQGDMRSVRLGQTYDCVFIHDAIVYMTTIDDLRAAIHTAYLHTRSGGAALFVPDHTRETFEPGTGHGGHDGVNRGLRYLEWTWDPDPSDHTYLVDYAFVLREEDGRVRVEHDRHVEGLFSHDEWMRALDEAGFEARSMRFEHSDAEGSHELFIAQRKG